VQERPAIQRLLLRFKIITQPPPLLASVISAAISLLALMVWPFAFAHVLPHLPRLLLRLVPASSYSVFYDLTIWGAHLVIIAILALVIIRSRLEELTRWMFLVFFTLLVVCEFARLIRGGLIPLPGWMQDDIHVMAAFSALTTAIVIVWITTAHKMARPPMDDYFTETTLFDAVTELPTLRIMKQTLGRSIQSANKSRFAIIMVQVDQYKRIHELLGHQAASDLIAQIALRLRRGLRRQDILARTGADEFVLLLRGARGDQALAVADHFQKTLAGIIPIEGHDMAITASMGVATYPEAGDSAAALIRNAETAMYHAQRKGSGSVELFTQDMAVLAQKRIAMERALRTAIERGELSLHYQPQVELPTGPVRGIEALLRWNSAEFGDVSPLDFLPIAEETRLITPITDWLLEEACRFAAAENATRATPLSIAVNIPPGQLQRDDLVSVVERCLAASGLSANLLEVEITENALMDNFPSTKDTLTGLRTLGVHIAIDDFGTGFSSMSYILRFHIDRLKIDQSFIRDATTSKVSAVVTSSIISLAHGLGIRVIAEGVETADQMRMLVQAGCEEGQGYLFSRPVSAENLRATVAELDSLAHQEKMRALLLSSGGQLPLPIPAV